jgi:uncharacterized protein
MKILIDIGHPAHVHYFKNFIWQMQKKGHEFIIVARERKNVFELLNACGFKYISRGKGSSNILGKILYLPKADYLLYKAAKKFNPDIFLSFGSAYAAQTSKILGKPYIAFDDTEHAKLEHILYVPFTNLICTPTCFKIDFGKKHRRFNGLLEMCYLHPNYYKPDPSVLAELNITEGDEFYVLRLISWDASHDIGNTGLSLADKRWLVKELSSRGRVLISSESRLPEDLEQYKIEIKPEKMHDLLYYSKLYIGEGATMATEAGLLGTPSILINTLSQQLGNFTELERYGIVFSFADSKKAFQKMHTILDDKDGKKNWKERQVKFFNSKIDVTKWMIDLIDGYPPQ